MNRSKLSTFFLYGLLLTTLLVNCGTVPSTLHVVRVNTTPVMMATSAPLVNASKIDAYLTQLAEKGVLGGSVLVARNGAVFAKGYGVADKDANILNTPETRFRLGSVSKQFTAVAILLLQERGKLHVQDSLCHYMPVCPTAWRSITLEQLLTHTSGIPDYISFADFAVTWTQPVSVEQLIARFKDKPLEFPSGSRFRYTSSGYVLLGYVIERVTGASYATFLQRQIFDPLGMHNTGYDSRYPALPQHATGYYAGYVKPDAYDMSVLYAAGALYSTVKDLYRWDQALTGLKVLSKQSFEAMIALHAPCPAAGSGGGCLTQADAGYGYGWFLAQEKQGALVYHIGRIDGFLAYNGFYPERDLDVVVLSNLESTDDLRIGTTLASMV